MPSRSDQRKQGRPVGDESGASDSSAVPQSNSCLESSSSAFQRAENASRDMDVTKLSLSSDHLEAFQTRPSFLVLGSIPPSSLVQGLFLAQCSGLLLAVLGIKLGPPACETPLQPSERLSAPPPGNIFSNIQRAKLWWHMRYSQYSAWSYTPVVLRGLCGAGVRTPGILYKAFVLVLSVILQS